MSEPTNHADKQQQQQLGGLDELNWLDDSTVGELSWWPEPQLLPSKWSGQCPSSEAAGHTATQQSTCRVGTSTMHLIAWWEHDWCTGIAPRMLNPKLWTSDAP